MQTSVYYATNRAHEGPQRFKPTGYGAKFSSDGMENLRFGQVRFDADPAVVQRLLLQARGASGPGDGEALQVYLARCVQDSQRILAYPESIPKGDVSEKAKAREEPVRLGSEAMFHDLREDMLLGRDLLIMVHGYNVSWPEAVATAAALEAVLNRPDPDVELQSGVRVILFSWPSDGQALPFVSYKSDRADARGSAGAFGRALLKLRDLLHEQGRTRRLQNVDMRREERRLRAMRLPDNEVRRALATFEATELCGQQLHLLAHSMGNYVLQNALERLWDHSPGSSLPHLFDQVFLCAADVDDDVLEPGKPLQRLHQISNRVSVYHNAGDKALRVSDYTKGNPDRLGQRGAARPTQLHQKVMQVDCSALVSGLTQHSYYTNGRVARDIRLALQGLEPQDAARGLQASSNANSWQF